jgi:hypothetical protein
VTCAAIPVPATACPSGTICNSTNYCATPQYTINGDGTATDNVTGLVWQQDVPSCPLPNTDYCDYTGAVAYCESLSLGAFISGWRLPRVAELFTLVDVGSSPPFIDSAVFPSTPDNNPYWTNSNQSGAYEYAVLFSSVPAVTAIDGVALSAYVRCVH